MMTTVIEILDTLNQRMAVNRAQYDVMQSIRDEIAQSNGLDQVSGGLHLDPGVLPVVQPGEVLTTRDGTRIVRVEKRCAGKSKVADGTGKAEKEEGWRKQKLGNVRVVWEITTKLESPFTAKALAEAIRLDGRLDAASYDLAWCQKWFCAKVDVGRLARVGTEKPWQVVIPPSERKAAEMSAKERAYREFRATVPTPAVEEI